MNLLNNYQMLVEDTVRYIQLVGHLAS